MSHGCFISYKKEDLGYVKIIAKKLTEKGITHSYLDRTIDSDNIDTVISVLRTKYMNNKPVTLFLIGKYSYEDTAERWIRTHGRYYPHSEYNEQSFVIRELRATLSDYDGNPRHGVVGIVLPEMTDEIFRGCYNCPHCGTKVQYVMLNDETVIREFHENYYLKSIGKGCDHFNDDGRYCVLCTLEEFLKDPEPLIDKAYEKSLSKLAYSVHYRDINHDYRLRDE